MSEFKAIETQEQLEEVLKDRLARERATVERKYENYLSPEEVETKYNGYLSPKDVEEKYKDHLSPEQVADLQTKIKGYETNSVKMRIAQETGLSFEAVNFLQGDDEDSIRQSAESLKNLVGVNNIAPLASNEPSGTSGDAALLNTLRNLEKGD